MFSCTLHGEVNKAARNEVSFKRKVELLSMQTTIPHRAVVKLPVFSCGHKQIQGIIKKKDVILSEYEAIAPASRKRHCGIEFININEARYGWYFLARPRNVPVSGPLLKKEALVLAEQMGHHQFKASNGWLESFKKCHNIRQFAVSGEADDVAEEMVESWQSSIARQ